MSEKEVIKLGLVAGRHPLPVDQYIVSEELTSRLTQLLEEGNYDGITHLVHSQLKVLLDNEGDVKVELYITGLTAVALAALSWCNANGVEVVAMNYDRETGKYLSQAL